MPRQTPASAPGQRVTHRAHLTDQCWTVYLARDAPSTPTTGFLLHSLCKSTHSTPLASLTTLFRISHSNAEDQQSQQRAATRDLRNKEDEDREDSRRRRLPLSSNTQNCTPDDSLRTSRDSCIVTPASAPGIENRASTSEVGSTQFKILFRVDTSVWIMQPERNTRSIAQRRRRERERREREHQFAQNESQASFMVTFLSYCPFLSLIYLYTLPKIPSTSRRSLGQRQRWARVREERETHHPCDAVANAQLPTPPAPTPSQPSMVPPIYRMQQRQAERRRRQDALAPYPTPPSTLSLEAPQDSAVLHVRRNPRAQAQQRRRQAEQEAGLIGQGRILLLSLSLDSHRHFFWLSLADEPYTEATSTAGR